MRVNIDSFLDSTVTRETLGHFEMYESFPGEIVEGDTFTVSAGCNHQHSVATYGTVTDDCMNKRSEEHTSVIQSLMRTSYAFFCSKTKNPYIYFLEGPNSTHTTHIRFTYPYSDFK